MAKLSCLWEDGIYPGIRGSSGEVVVADFKGVWRTRTVQRKPMEDRWRPEGIEMARWAPWEKKEGDPRGGRREVRGHAHDGIGGAGREVGGC